MQRVARNVRANNYTSASMVCIALDGIFVTRRGFCTLCLIYLKLTEKVFCFCRRLFCRISVGGSSAYCLTYENLRSLHLILRRILQNVCMFVHVCMCPCHASGM